MPLEALILRRVFPVPVTFADLRRAHDAATPDIRAWYAMGACLAKYAAGIDIRAHWHAAIKEATGAVDEVYAVIDGREVRVATVQNLGHGNLSETASEFMWLRGHVGCLLEVADEAGYWQRPHEVHHNLEEPQMSHKTMARITANSIAAAGGK